MINVLQGKKKENCDIKLSEIELLVFNLSKEKLSDIDNVTFPNQRVEQSLMVDVSVFPQYSSYQWLSIRFFPKKLSVTAT